MVQKNVEMKFYTLEDIAKHNSKDNKSTWIIIKNKVYDITNYLDEHPAGRDVIDEWAGKDATKEFDNAGHSGDAKIYLKSLKIGEVVEEQRKKKKAEDKLKAVSVQKQTIFTDTDRPLEER